MVGRRPLRFVFLIFCEIETSCIWLQITVKCDWPKRRELKFRVWERHRDQVTRVWMTVVFPCLQQLSTGALSLSSVSVSPVAKRALIMLQRTRQSNSFRVLKNNRSKCWVFLSVLLRFLRQGWSVWRSESNPAGHAFIIAKNQYLPCLCLQAKYSVVEDGFIYLSLLYAIFSSVKRRIQCADVRLRRKSQRANWSLEILRCIIESSISFMWD